MKRHVTVITIIIMISGCLIFLPGCGNDTEEAKKYMNAGDNIISNLQTNSETLVTQMTEIGNDLSNGTITSSSQLETRTEEYEKNTKDLVEQANKAKAEYKKILDLNGVDDYADYAKLGIDLIGTAVSFLEEMNQLLQETLDYLKKAESGTLTENDNTEYSNSIKNMQVDIETKTEEANETADKMKELKKEKDL